MWGGGGGGGGGWGGGGVVGGICRESWPEGGRFWHMGGRARHSVRAAGLMAPGDRRARSNAPYLLRQSQNENRWGQSVQPYDLPDLFEQRDFGIGRDEVPTTHYGHLS